MGGVDITPSLIAIINQILSSLPKVEKPATAPVPTLGSHDFLANPQQSKGEEALYQNLIAELEFLL